MTDACQILFATEDADPYVEAYAGKVNAVAPDGTVTLAGRALVKLVTLDAAASAGVAASDVLANAGELAEYAQLIDPASVHRFAAPLMTMLDEDVVASRNLLVVERLHVLPEWRGVGLGRRLLDASLDLLRSGARVAVLRAYPLQLEHWYDRGTVDPWIARMGLRTLPTDPRIARPRLQAYYERNGFARVPGTSLMARDLYPLRRAANDDRQDRVA